MTKTFRSNSTTRSSLKRRYFTTNLRQKHLVANLRLLYDDIILRRNVDVNMMSHYDDTIVVVIRGRYCHVFL